MKTKMFYYYILILVAAIWQTQARAADYYVEIGEVHITSDNYKNISAAGGFPAVKKGKITFDNSTRTLTLNNVLITPDEGKRGIYVFIDYEWKNRPLIIKLIGHNVIEATKESSVGTNSIPIVMTGSGSLIVSGNVSISSGKQLTIQGGCTIEAKSPIWADTITINDAQVHAIRVLENEPCMRGFWGIKLKGGSYLASPQGATCEYRSDMYHANWGWVFVKGEEICGEVLIKRGKNTGIDNPTTLPSTKEDEIYTLDGIRMKLPFERLPKGVYIVNGKKKVKG
ncbi:arginase [Hoylesella loescheii]|uniref:arginase n=1 Tax=Hoylesella loescheii TaxID=840 RepID=UPI0028E4FD76|nr:arginase [Hoylesella loescheii]